MPRLAAAVLALAAVLVPADAEDPPTATADPHDEAQVATLAVRGHEAAGELGDLALEVQRSSLAEVIPGGSKEKSAVAWTFSTRATKDRDSQPAVRFLLVPWVPMSWRSTVDTAGTWLEPELFLIADDFLVLSSRGPSMSEEVTAARESAARLVARILGREDDPGQDCAGEFREKGLGSSMDSVTKHARHLGVELLGEAPFETERVRREYPLYWLRVVRTPDQGPITVAWLPPAGVLGRAPDGAAHVAPDSADHAKLVQAERQTDKIIAGVVERWLRQPKTDIAARTRWVEEAGAEILATYQATGVYIPGTNRHEIDMMRLARYLGLVGR